MRLKLLVPFLAACRLSDADSASPPTREEACDAFCRFVLGCEGGDRDEVADCVDDICDDSSGCDREHTTYLQCIADATCHALEEDDSLCVREEAALNVCEATVDDGSCEWHGNCSTPAPNGAYDCGPSDEGDRNMIYQCIDGSWYEIADCGYRFDADGYACSCSGGCGLDVTECSYASNICEGEAYPTCGDDHEATLGEDGWECRPD